MLTGKQTELDSESEVIGQLLSARFQATLITIRFYMLAP